MNSMSGQVSKIEPMWARTSSPLADSPAVWLSKTMSGACMATIASRSWAFQAAL